jgi:hypothetical protein
MTDTAHINENKRIGTKNQMEKAAKRRMRLRRFAAFSS